MMSREATEAAQEPPVLPTSRRDHEIALIFLIISWSENNTDTTLV